LAAALSLNNSYKKILEIGTYNGEFSNLLSKLFPESKIITIDLPDSDPILKSYYNRDDNATYLKFVNDQKNNTSNKNIISIKKNTFFLLNELNLNEKFDFIWVDGGHLYPDIAWDLCNAYFLLRKGGILMCDDIVLSRIHYNNGYVSTDSRDVLKYIEERIGRSATYLLKRLNPDLYPNKKTRKYVSVLVK
jgi:predicted O-methyltransferase YrrM